MDVMFWLKMWGMLLMGIVLIMLALYPFLNDIPLTREEWDDRLSCPMYQKALRAQIAGQQGWWHRLRQWMQRPRPRHSYTDG